MLNSGTLNILTAKFIIGALFFVRISGLMVAGPFFKHQAIPVPVKVALAAIFSMIVTSAYWEQQPQFDFHLWNLVFLVIKEFLVGVSIGYAADIVFQAATFAGGLIDFDMGYHTAMLFDANSTTPTLIGEMYSIIALMLFLFLNGHHFLIESIFASARAVPLTYFAVTDSTVNLLTRLVTSAMIIGIKMSAPVLIALFLTNLALALLARIAPQTNIFILSFQLKIAIGLLVMISTVPLFMMVTKYFLTAMETETMKLLMSLNPTRV